MTRVLIGAGIVAIAVTIYALVDLAFSSRATRGLPKAVWALVILVLPVLGPVLWFVIGRPRASRPTGPRGPDDDPSFLRGAGSRPPAPPVDEAVLRRMEEELGTLDADSEDDGEGRRR